MTPLLKLLFLVIALIGIAFLLLSIRVLLRRGGRFSMKDAGYHPSLRKNGVRCAKGEEKELWGKKKKNRPLNEQQWKIDTRKMEKKHLLMTELHDLINIPSRPPKPRLTGITMVIDTGLGLSEAESLVQTSGQFIDYIKLGFGTALLTKNLADKLKIYQDGGLIPYFGGTLFEAFYVRNQVDVFRKNVEKYNLTTVEISDGVVKISPDARSECITLFAKDFTVLSEVGSKIEASALSIENWISQMNADLQAGSSLVIAEARESGTIGLFDEKGQTDEQMVQRIVSEVEQDRILWETPRKEQYTWFINQFGANVNLGNLSPSQVLPLEAMRLGLRGDTLLNYIKQ